ncbi:MAG: glycerol-3-phosphate 1-O-acyltransferase PlsY [Bacteroidales bacterium]|jgi:glycerol-3-phosphate acyltransferase PlsY|nr:glycerol-3-phosphate 1-O-acyltransferase PlsY [Bacteroidales bacterium]
MILLPLFLAYLVGSIPNAVWIGRVFFNVDVRKEGSRNAGATNTFRVLGWKPGVCVLVLDLLKGIVPLALFKILPDSWVFANSEITDSSIWLEIAIAITTVIGHVFPIYVGFRGGKGVATLVGVLIMLYPQVFLIVLGVFVIVFLIFRYISLSSMCAAISLPLLQFAFFQTDKLLLLIFAIFIAIFIPLTHVKNIKRLLQHEEPNFKFKTN